MRRRVVILENMYHKLLTHLFQDSNEQAAFVLCKLSVSTDEIKFLVNDVIPIEAKDIKYNDRLRIYYGYESYMPAVKQALLEDKCFFIAHSHIDTITTFSEVDDIEERKLLKFAYNRIGKHLHGSMVFSDANTFDARVYNKETDSFEPINKLVIMGDTYRFLKSVNVEQKPINYDIYNRNILAFGEALQYLVRDLNVGVVGCGGTGSAVIEELCRLGVGKLTIVDNQDFSSSNITRMHGSSLKDKGIPKVTIMQHLASEIGLDTEIVPIYEKLDNPATASQLKNCDIIFSCLDNIHFARAILNLITIYYGVPLIDCGIKFYTKESVLIDIFARIDLVTPYTSCLLCRKVIDLNISAAEMLGAEEYEKLVKEGYAKELQDDKIQAMPYNTLVASQAVIAFIQLLTNFKGQNDYHTIYRLNKNKVVHENIDGNKYDVECLCHDNNGMLLKGDTEPFLGLCW